MRSTTVRSESAGAGDALKLTGLSDKRSRAVVIFDEAKTVGAVATVTGDAETTATVAPEKLGSVTGRLFDADGNPAANAEVRAWLVLDRTKYDNLPDEVTTLSDAVPFSTRAASFLCAFRMPSRPVRRAGHERRPQPNLLTSGATPVRVCVDGDRKDGRR